MGGRRLPAPGRIAAVAITTLLVASSVLVWSQRAVSGSSSGWTNVGPHDEVSNLNTLCGSGDVCTNPSVTSGKVGSFAYDPAFPNVLYVAGGNYPQSFPVAGSGVYRSADSGKTWSQVNNGLTFLSVSWLADVPGNPDSVLALTPVGIFRTIDAGSSWRETLSCTGCLQAQVTRNGSVFAITYDSLVASTNGGATWSTLATFPSTEVPSTLAVQGNGSVIFVGTDVLNGRSDSSNWAILKSVDGGKAFTTSTFNSGSSFARPPGEIVIDPWNPSIVWLPTVFSSGWNSSTQVLLSRDGGVTFKGTSLSGVHGNVQYIAYDPRDSSRVYAGTDGTFYKSTDGGATFQGVNFSADTREVIVDPLSDNVVWLGSDQGLWRSSDYGATWSDANAGRSTNAVPAVAAAGNRIFAVLQDYFGLAYSCDSGATWAVSLSTPCTTFKPGAASLFTEKGYPFVNPYNESNVFVLFISTSRNGLIVSNDGGATFSPVLLSNQGPGYLSAASPLVFEPDDPRVVYVVDGQEAVKSTDYGRSWSALPAPAGFRTIGIGLEAPYPIYASNSQGFFKSADGGASWLMQSSQSFTSLSVNPLDPLTIYGVSADRLSLLVSHDGGATFSAMSMPPGPTPYWGLNAININGRPVVLVASIRALYASDVTGSSWVDLTASLPYPIETQSFFLSSGGDAYLSTWGTGIWRFQGFAASLGTLMSTTVTTPTPSTSPSTTIPSTTAPSTVQTTPISSTPSYSTTTPISSVTTPLTSPSTGSSSGGIPEFPFQLVAATALVLIVAASYLIVRAQSTKEG